MRKPLLFFTAFVIGMSTTAFAQLNKCAEVMIKSPLELILKTEQARMEQDALLKELEATEKAVAQGVASVGQVEKYSAYVIERKIDSMSYFITLADHVSAVDIVRLNVRRTEEAYVRVKALDTKIAETELRLKDMNLDSKDRKEFQKLLSDLNKEQLREIRTLGENYSEYKAVHARLDLLTERYKKTEDTLRLQVLERVRAQMGVNRAFLQMFPEILSSEKPTIAQIRELFQARPEALQAKLKRDLFVQRVGILLNFFTDRTILNVVKNGIDKIAPMAIKPHLQKFFKEAYNLHAAYSHYPMINRLVSEVLTPAQKYDLLVQAVAQDAEILITLSRRTDSLDTWRVMKDFVEKTEHKNINMGDDKTLLSMMNDAEITGRRLGLLPYQLDPGQNTALTRSLVLTTAMAVAYYFSDDLLASGSDLLDSFTSKDIKEIITKP